MKKLGVLILFLAAAGTVGSSRLMRLYNPEAISAQNYVDLYLYDKTGLDRLSYLLVDSLQAVNNKAELKWAANVLGWRTFQPGHYKIDRSFTYNEFLSNLARGIQDPLALTIVPGQQKEKIISFLSDRMRFDSSAIHQTMNDSSFIASKDLNEETMIGHFFPATYDIYWTSPPKEVLNRIFKEFNTRVVQTFRKRALELELSTNKVLALASIIEWEAIRDDEKPKISGLYWNRLNKGMRLQADPTVSYAINEQRRLYYEDYRVDHPYNTYIYKGLPPGPVNNPSLSSIKAALYPEDHNYIYMVAQPNGYHAFTETYAEHQRKSKEWREYLKKQTQAKPKGSKH